MQLHTFLDDLYISQAPRSNIYSVIFAAGNGTRMKSSMPKVLHKICGFEMLHYAVKLAGCFTDKISILASHHNTDNITAFINKHKHKTHTLIQEQQLGTGDAAKTYFSYLSSNKSLNDNDRILILYGDTPFITPQTISNLCSLEVDVGLLVFENHDHTNKYGRVMINNENIEKIIEFKDATEDQKLVSHCNSGVFCIKYKAFANLINQIKPNKITQEFYLTDIIELANLSGYKTGFVQCDAWEVEGVNSQDELAKLSFAFQRRINKFYMLHGTNLEDDLTTFISPDANIAQGTSIEPHVVIKNNVTIHQNTHIRAFSYLEGCTLMVNTIVGPFARIRPGTTIEEGGKVGNFVEIKNSHIGQNSKINHLSYVGDSDIGHNSNIGAGVVTCNYDGISKHKTTIGHNTFIGSNTILVAPVEIGDSAMTAAGSIIVDNVPSSSLAIARSRQTNKLDWVKKIFKQADSK